MRAKGPIAIIILLLFCCGLVAILVSGESTKVTFKGFWFKALETLGLFGVGFGNAKFVVPVNSSLLLCCGLRFVSLEVKKNYFFSTEK
jgi:hypothetical protein